MTQTIENLFPTVQAPLLVLDSWNYVQRLFLSGAAIPWHDPAAFDAVYRQALGLLRPQLATLDLNRLILAHAERQPDLLVAMTRRPRLSFPIKTLLADPALAQNLKQLIATTRDARGTRPLILTLCTPLELLRQLYEMAHDQAMPAESQDDAERAAVYLADFLTRAAHEGVAGLMVVDQTGQAGQSGFADAISPLVNLSKHMRWKLLLASQAELGDIHGIDLIWAPSHCTGQWMGDFLTDEPRTGIATVFSEVPAQAQPEQVLARIAELTR